MATNEELKFILKRLLRLEIGGFICAGWTYFGQRWHIYQPLYDAELILTLKEKCILLILQDRGVL